MSSRRLPPDSRFQPACGPLGLLDPWPRYPAGVFAALEGDHPGRCRRVPAMLSARSSAARLPPPAARGPGVHESHVRPDQPIPVYPNHGDGSRTRSTGLYVESYTRSGTTLIAGSGSSLPPPGRVPLAFTVPLQ